jgi:hypothetical protein
MESEAVKTEFEEYQLIRRHFDKMNEHALWKQAHKIFIPENNTGMEASHMQSLVKEYNDVTTHFSKNGRPGVVMTNESKVTYQQLMTSCLYKKQLRFERDLFTCSRKISGPDRIKSLLKEQFDRFHWDKKLSNDPHGKTRWSMTGKIGAKQDDLLISVLMDFAYGKELIHLPRNPTFHSIPEHLVGRTPTIEPLPTTAALEPVQKKRRL